MNSRRGHTRITNEQFWHIWQVPPGQMFFCASVDSHIFLKLKVLTKIFSDNWILWNAPELQITKITKMTCTQPWCMGYQNKSRITQFWHIWQIWSSIVCSSGQGSMFLQKKVLRRHLFSWWWQWWWFSPVVRRRKSYPKAKSDHPWGDTTIWMMTFVVRIMTMVWGEDNDDEVLLWTDKSQLTVVHTASQLSNHSAYQHISSFQFIHSYGLMRTNLSQYHTIKCMGES